MTYWLCRVLVWLLKLMVFFKLDRSQRYSDDWRHWRPMSQVFRGGRSHGRQVIFCTFTILTFVEKIENPGLETQRHINITHLLPSPHPCLPHPDLPTPLPCLPHLDVASPNHRRCNIWSSWHCRGWVLTSVVNPDPQSDKLDPDPNPHQFADDRPKCVEHEPIWALFKFLSHYLEARIRILISITVIRIRNTGPDQPRPW